MIKDLLRIINYMLHVVAVAGVTSLFMVMAIATLFSKLDNDIDSAQEAFILFLIIFSPVYLALKYYIAHIWNKPPIQKNNTREVK